MMRVHNILLCLVFGTGFSLVSATTKASIIVKPTIAPETISMVKPTVAPLVKKEMLNEPMIMNIPPKVQEKSLELTTAAPMPVPTPTPAPTHAPMMSTTPAPILSPSSVPIEETMEISADLKPLKIMGFIAEDGNVYEIEGRAGVGIIESRQAAAADAEQKQMHVCNYGSVVIYSDVPCEEVTNIEISEIEEQPEKTNEKEPIKATEQETDQNSTNKKKNKKRRLQPQQQVQQWNNNFNDDFFDDDFFGDYNDDDDYYYFTPQVQLVNRKPNQGNKRPLANQPHKNNKKHNNQQTNQQKQQLTQQQQRLYQQQIRQQKLRLQAQQGSNYQKRRKNVGQNPTRNENSQFQKKCQSARWKMTARCIGGERRVNSNWARRQFQ